MPADPSFAEIAAELARIAPGPGLPRPHDNSTPAAPAPHLPNTGVTPEERYALLSAVAPAGHPEGRDPLQEMAEALPPLDELTTEPPAPPAPFSSASLPRPPPPKRHRLLWLTAILVVVAGLAGAALMFRDTLEGWLGGGEEPAARTAAARPRSASSPGAGLPSGRQPGAATAPVAPAAAAGTPGATPGTPAATAGSPAAPPRTPAAATGTPAAALGTPAAAPATPAAGTPAAAPGAASPAAAGAVGASGASQAAAAPPASAVEKITWEPVRGGLDVVLWGNGAFRQDLFDLARLVKPVREVLRIRGISQPFAATQLRVGTPELLQIRIGFHQEGGSSQLHVVLDLGGPEVVVTGVEAREKQLRVHVRGR